MRKLFEAVDACADQLDRLNNQFPHLAKKSTRESVSHWRNRKIQIRLHQTHDESAVTGNPTEDVKKLAMNLLETNGLEETLDILFATHQLDITLPKLIHLIGKGEYIVALRKDAGLLLENAISYDQIAQLWNDLDRPAMGGPNWNGRSVSILVE